MSAATPPGEAESKEHRNAAIWDRARLGVVVPLCIIVAVAILCIIVAALTSANRADEVALENEKNLLTRAIVNHADWSLRRLRNVIASDNTIRGLDLDGPATFARPRLERWLEPMRDLDLMWVVSYSDQLIYGQVGRLYHDANTPAESFVFIKPLVAHLRGETPIPDRMVRLVGQRTDPTTNVPDTVMLQMLLGRLAAVIAVPIAAANESPSSAPPPMLIAARFLEDTLLGTIGHQVGLPNLRMVSARGAPDGDHVFDIVDARNDPVVRFAWTPKRPGAEILHAVFPFLGIALAGFVLFAGLVLRFMRRTAETIMAGEKRLRYLALHDPLCGLPNRNYFSDRLEMAIEEVKSGKPAAAVLYIDLDHFKDVNDTLGHPVGDELIRNVTRRVTNAVRPDDLVARLGGDEFAVLTSVTSDPAALLGVADRIIGALSAPFAIDGHTIVIGASIGIAIIDTAAGGAADVMRYADMALYRAKNEGRSRACVYDAAMDADLSKRKLIEQELREAIEKGQLEVLYQPIVNASGEKIVGVEALARWPHPVRGMIPPSEFIPIAEHSGLIIELGNYVLRRACMDGRAWPDLTVAVNVSPLQFRQHDYVSVVERILNETGFQAPRLELELTESTLIGNVDSAEAAMNRLKALGVRLALDDFGTGYSSLQYLRRFPFDKLKIDRSFVLSIEKAADAAAIVHAVVSLGRGLGMKVTAEGVESADQHLFLRAAGVHFMQGYRFGKPMPAASISASIAAPGSYRGIESDAVAALAG